ncbi:transposase [Desulfogranum japonicum]|uniref:transposase n=1 Tax=Desulfogranum japonicum TaxID=231447 RepID=UPI0009FDDDCA|nr:transposase [Desulfogranum japonicum]
MTKSKVYHTIAVHLPTRQPKRTVRKNLNADALIALAREEFSRIKDHRAKNSQIELTDVMMSALAMFHLKDPSLLAFEKRRQEEPENLHFIYGVGRIPCDSQMRSALDDIAPNVLRPAFRTVFKHLQRGKALENMTFLDGHYLISGDGTGYYSSSKVSSDYCLKKVTRNGETKYYLQMYAAAIVHPDRKEVVPLYPEMITKQDGSTKNDCERNASGRFWDAVREDHPHLKIIALEDGLSSNSPHIRHLQSHNIRFILGAKEGDHEHLFAHVDKAAERGEVTDLTLEDPENSDIIHCFRFINQVPLNASNEDLLVNFMEHWEVDKEGNVINRFAWVTDLEITTDNAMDIMRAGRSRWRIENETFNTLKNQGYNLGHNYGLGKKHLSGVFTTLMMLAFLIDQACQISCWLYQEALRNCGSKRDLWEKVRGVFHMFTVDSMETIYRAIAFGYEKVKLVNPLTD